MRRFNELQIDQPIISVFGSGHSIGELSESDIEWIKRRSFLITMNYAPINIQGHLNIWSDKLVSDWMETFWQGKTKNQLFLVRERAFRNNESQVKPLVDFWFSERAEKLMGNYTIVWLLQLLERHFSHHSILVFGLDMKGLSAQRAKWYDDHIDFDRNKRVRSNFERKLNQCASQLNRYIQNKNLFSNCNPDSQYDGFKKVNWREVLR